MRTRATKEVKQRERKDSKLTDFVLQLDLISGIEF